MRRTVKYYICMGRRGVFENNSINIGSVITKFSFQITYRVAVKTRCIFPSLQASCHSWACKREAHKWAESRLLKYSSEVSTGSHVCTGELQNIQSTTGSYRIDKAAIKIIYHALLHIYLGGVRPVFHLDLPGTSHERQAGFSHVVNNPY